jgi:putative serine protease PepD
VCFAQSTCGTTISDKAETGELVDQVIADGPAAKAGISIHDIITDIEGTAVRSPRQIVEALARHKPGDPMELTVVRASNGARTEITMTLGANPRDPSQPYMGLAVLAFVLLVPESESPPAGNNESPGI